MASNTSPSDIRTTWESAAPGWAKWEEAFSHGLANVTDTLIDLAEVRAGMRVLDVACGAGSQSLQVATRVGPQGTVVASDISPTMLQHVRQNAIKAGLRNIETVEAAAEGLGRSQNPFDAAICRLGLMLFPSPRAALTAGRYR